MTVNERWRRPLVGLRQSWFPPLGASRATRRIGSCRPEHQPAYRENPRLSSSDSALDDLGPPQVLCAEAPVVMRFVRHALESRPLLGRQVVANEIGQVANQRALVAEIAVAEERRTDVRRVYRIDRVSMRPGAELD